MRGRRDGAVVDRSLLLRAFAVLGATEAAASMLAFTVVLRGGGWTWGAEPGDALLALASGTAFAAISVGQMANAFACRSNSRPVWRLNPTGNVLVLYAVAAELVLLATFLGVPAMAHLLGGSWPTPTGWLLALSAAPAVVLVDAAAKTIASHRR
jgi:magnesium-transporting ATPase (P-type)